MSDRVRCHCQHCTIRSLMGPAVLIALGILFLLDQLRGGYFYIGNTYPILFIVVGVISLASSLAPTDGHISDPLPPTPPRTMPAPPQNPYAGQGPAR